VSRQGTRLTWLKADRALRAIDELIDCDDATPTHIADLTHAAGIVRALREELGERRETADRAGRGET